MNKRLFVLALLAGFAGSVMAEEMQGHAQPSGTPAATATPAPKHKSGSKKKSSSSAKKEKAKPAATPAAVTPANPQ